MQPPFFSTCQLLRAVKISHRLLWGKCLPLSVNGAENSKGATSVSDSLGSPFDWHERAYHTQVKEDQIYFDRLYLLSQTYLEKCIFVDVTMYINVYNKYV